MSTLPSALPFRRSPNHLLLLPLMIALACQGGGLDPDAPRDPSVPGAAGAGPTLPAVAAEDPAADILKSYPLIGSLMLGNRAKGFDAATLEALVAIDNAAKEKALKAAIAFDAAAGSARTDLGTGAITADHIDALVAADRALREVALNALIDGMRALPSGGAGERGSSAQGESSPRAVSGTLGLLVSAEGRTVPEEPGNAAYMAVVEVETARAAAWTQAFSKWMQSVSAGRGTETTSTAFADATRTLFDAGDASMRSRLELAPRLIAASGNPAEMLVSARFSSWLNLTWEGKPRASGLPVPVASSEVPSSSALSGPGMMSKDGLPGPGMAPGITGGLTPGSGMMQPGTMQPPGSMQPGSMQSGSMQPPGSMQSGSMQSGSMQSGSMQPPGSMQSGSMQPPGSMQSGSMQSGSMQ
ncbi:MAG: hypothetical protein EXR69_10890, partial [Myxococcales bacterium]|nr:hypothetical protein [Myxococcales bacterium]